MYKEGKLILSSPILKHEYTKDNNWYEYVWFEDTFNLSEIGNYETKYGEIKLNLIDGEDVIGFYSISGDTLLIIDYKSNIKQNNKSNRNYNRNDYHKIKVETLS